MRNFLAELLATFFLVFCGTGAITINEVTQGTIGHLGIAVSFGLIVLILIYTIGPVSGAHMNPAVSLIMVLKKKITWRQLGHYLMAQCLGAILASGTLRLLFPDSEYLGATLPSGSALQSFLLEIILTFFLVWVILMLPGELKKLHGGIIGAVVMLEALFAGPICGASMNPVRSLAPAIVSGQYQHLWIYLFAPFLGAIIAYYSATLFSEDKS